jgi:hypothetical protein
MATQQKAIRLTRWSGGQHPTTSNITRIMQQDGLRPYRWETKPNQRYAVRSQGYSKVLFVAEGTMELLLPDSNQRVRHGSVSGQKGAICLEAAIRN